MYIYTEMTAEKVKDEYILAYKIISISAVASIDCNVVVSTIN